MSFKYCFFLSLLKSLEKIPIIFKLLWTESMLKSSKNFCELIPFSRWIILEDLCCFKQLIICLISLRYIWFIDSLFWRIFHFWFLALKILTVPSFSDQDIIPFSHNISVERLYSRRTKSKWILPSMLFLNFKIKRHS